jgi:hypothetical protein
MRKLIYLIVILISAYQLGAQDRDLLDIKKSEVLKEEMVAIVKGVAKDPELYNTFWGEFLKRVAKKDSVKWRFLSDMNIEFKTFEAQDKIPASLGFSYKLDLKYGKYTENLAKHSRGAQALNFSANGNVAFKKENNPIDFLESNLDYSFTKFKGGVTRVTDNSVLTELNNIEMELAKLDDPNSKEAQALWQEFSKKLKLNNQFYYGVSPKLGFESNQDFSKTQLTYGLVVSGGIKAWDDSNRLAKLNIFDYPFALIRWLLGTDKTLTPYGSTLPTIQFAVDFVNPTSDSLRKVTLGELKPFPRSKLEAGFKTFIVRKGKENIFFVANAKMYSEINPDDKIKNARLDVFNYYVFALQSSSGLFVSYANGKLPFDAKKDEVYSIGFNYKF